MPLVTRRMSLLGLASFTVANTQQCWAYTEAGPIAPPPVSQAEASWILLRDHFITPDGRAVDTGNGGASHSEGQGYALLFAARHDDRATFDRVLAWTRRALRRPDDQLHAWRWQPGHVVPVEDPNNATDGDLLIAWALLVAEARWGDVAHGALARAIGRDLLGRCVREYDGRTLLLPASAGFEHADHVVVNPSYLVFPALRALARALPDPRWARVEADGLALLRSARFGRWGLPADWVRLERTGRSVMPAAGWPARFGFDALRVPLHLAWAGLANEPALAAATAFWTAPGQSAPAAWVDLRSGWTAPFPASVGVEAVAALCTGVACGRIGELPAVARATDYYAAALVMLARLAAADLRTATSGGVTLVNSGIG